MKKREIVMSIIIVAGLVLVMLCMVKTSDIGRRLSALEIEQQRPCNVSVSVTCVPTPSLKDNKMNLTITGTGQDHLQVNNQLGVSSDTENIVTPETCASQWLQDEVAVGETLACIEEYVANEKLRMQGHAP